MALFANRDRVKKHTYYLRDNFYLNEAVNLKNISLEGYQCQDVPLELINCKWELFFVGTYFSIYKYEDTNSLMILKMTTQPRTEDPIPGQNPEEMDSAVVPLAHFGVFEFQPNCALPTKNGVFDMFHGYDFTTEISFCIYKLPLKSIPLHSWDYRDVPEDNISFIAATIADYNIFDRFENIYLVPDQKTHKTGVCVLQRPRNIFVLDGTSEADRPSFWHGLLSKKTANMKPNFVCESMVEYTDPRQKIGDARCWNSVQQIFQIDHPQDLLTPKMWKMGGGLDGKVLCISDKLVVKYTHYLEVTMLNKLMEKQEIYKPHILKYYATWRGISPHGASDMYDPFMVPISKPRDCVLMENIGDSINTFDIESREFTDDNGTIKKGVIDLTCRIGLALQYWYILQSIIKHTVDEDGGWWWVSDADHNFALIRDEYSQRTVDISGQDVTIPASHFVLKIFDLSRPGWYIGKNKSDSEKAEQKRKCDLEIWDGMLRFLKGTKYDTTRVGHLTSHEDYLKSFKKLVDYAKTLTQTICGVDIEERMKRSFDTFTSTADRDQQPIDSDTDQREVKRKQVNPSKTETKEMKDTCVSTNTITECLYPPTKTPISSANNLFPTSEFGKARVKKNNNSTQTQAYQTHLIQPEVERGGDVTTDAITEYMVPSTQSSLFPKSAYSLAQKAKQ